MASGLARRGRTGGARGAGRILGLALALSAIACTGAPLGAGSPGGSTPGKTAAPPATTAPVAHSPSPRPVLTPVPVHPAPRDVSGLAERLVAFADGVQSATRAIPRVLPEARRPDESFDAYAVRALNAARDRVGPIRDLVDEERQSLLDTDLPSCPTATRYKVLVNAYSVVVAAVWAAVYAPDAGLLEQGLADLDALNAALGSAVERLKTAPDACIVALETDVAALASRVVGTQTGDILRSPDRLHESAMGNLVADALRQSSPDADAALLNSGNLRADLVADPPSAGERPGEITWGELVAVLPFGDRVATLPVTTDQLAAALRNGFAPACDPRFAGGPGRFPQLSGIAVAFHCEGVQPAIEALWRTDGGNAGSQSPMGPTESIRLVTVDYLVAGGDGYALPTSDAGGDGDTLLGVTMDYLVARSPVSPAVEGRIVGP